MNKTRIILLNILLLFALLLVPIGMVAGNHTKTVSAVASRPVAIPVKPVAPMPNLTTLLQLVNQERSAVSELPLKLNPLLNQSAGDHCSDMVTQNYWQHNNPQGKTPLDWILGTPGISIWNNVGSGTQLAYADAGTTSGYDVGLVARTEYTPSAGVIVYNGLGQTSASNATLNAAGVKPIYLSVEVDL